MTSIHTLGAKISRFFHYFKLALAGGEHQSFTSGSINKAIFMLSIPMILEMVMESLFAIIDIFFVGKIGVNAVATIGLTESIMMIMYSVAIGISMAATAVVARRVGENKPEKAADAAFQALILSSVVSVAFGIVGILFAKDILRLMGAQPEIIEEGYRYTMIMMGGNLSVMLLFLLNAVFRGAGDASVAMRSLIIANGFNIILDPLFIFGLGPIPGFGLEGAAIATTIGRSIGIGYQIYCLVQGKSVVNLLAAKWRIHVATMANLIKIALGGIGQFMIETLSWVFLVRIISEFGAEALAGYTIAFRIIVFTILPAWGLSNAAATLVGQNLGAGFPDRAEKSVWKCAFYNMVFLAAISLVFIIWAEYFIGLFNSQAEVIHFGSLGLRYIACGYIFFAYGMVIAQSFNGAGDTRTPTLLNFICFWVVQIPLAMFLSFTLGMDTKGVYIAIALSSSLLALLGVWVFSKGKWKLQKV
jgi:putative MATE family efflux protein